MPDHDGRIWNDRHPSVAHFAPLFTYDHLSSPHARSIAGTFADVAAIMLGNLADGPELAAGLRKLVEAKDCMVRQAIHTRR